VHFGFGAHRRPVLRRLSRALIVYGVVGVILAVAGLASLAWAGARLGAFGGGADAEMTKLTTTVRSAATALRDASDSARSFTSSLDQTEPAVRRSAEAIRQIRPRLAALQQQADSIDILGARPLGSLGELFGQISTQLDGLDTQLDTVGDSLTADQGALRKNADSLGAVATSLDEVARDLADTSIESGIADMRTVLMIGLLLLVLWTAIPGVGALALGLWMRRELSGPERGLRRRVDREEPVDVDVGEAETKRHGIPAR
jgi:hypothetical protein